MSCKYGGIGDIFCDHGFYQTVSADENEISGFLYEVERKGLRNDVAINFARPVPVKVCNGVSAFDEWGCGQKPVPKITGVC